MNIFKGLFERKMLITCAGRTDTGLRREGNEDNFAVVPDLNLYFVADGMGGHLAGEVASRIAIDNLVDFFSRERMKRIIGHPQEIRHQMIQAFIRTNERVMAMAETNEDQHGMGCTLIAGLIDQMTIHTCHVGDVRCYVLTGKGLQQITTDHRWGATPVIGVEAWDKGSKSFPGSNVLTRAIGYPFSEDPEYHSVGLEPGSRILFCSDGLWTMMADEEIGRILSSAVTPEIAGETFISRANAAGGEDNITAVVVFLGG